MHLCEVILSERWVCTYYTSHSMFKYLWTITGLFRGIWFHLWITRIPIPLAEAGCQQQQKMVNEDRMKIVEDTLLDYVKNDIIKTEHSVNTKQIFKNKWDHCSLISWWYIQLYCSVAIIDFLKLLITWQIVSLLPVLNFSVFSFNSR